MYLYSKVSVVWQIATPERERGEFATEKQESARDANNTNTEGRGAI
jgi:hypothetical protein